MARSKSHDPDEEVVKHTGKLPRAYSPHVGGNRYVVYCHRHDKESTIVGAIVWSFNEVYAVKWMLNLLIGPNGSYDEREDFGGRRAIVTDTDIVISMFESQHDLYEIAKHRLDLSPLQQSWSDDSLQKNIMRFKYGRLADETTPTNSSDSPQSPEVVRLHGDPPPTKRGKARRDDNSGGRVREVREKPDRKPKPDGLISAGDLAAGLGVEARIFRGALRALKFEKPAHGWAWSPKEAESIKAQVKKELDGGKKKKS
jgi:hypothetical protein